jgi:hypothetical protein
MDKNVYIVIGEYGVDCFSNLSKLIRAYPFTYHPVYDALNRGEEYINGKYRVIKTKIK